MFTKARQLPITAFMSVGPKAAGFAILIRVLMVAFPATYGKWLGLVWLLAVLTMTVGNCVAIVQSNIKRMLAYSSIAHAGYILVAVTTRNQEGVAAILFYTMAYALMNIGAFTIVALVGRKAIRNPTSTISPASVSSNPVGRRSFHPSVVSGGNSTDSGLCRKVFHLPRRARIPVRLADDHRRHQQRHFGLLLSSRHCGDVHEGTGGRLVPGCNDTFHQSR